jgi:hypothetical protein
MRYDAFSVFVHGISLNTSLKVIASAAMSAFSVDFLEAKHEIMSEKYPPTKNHLSIW